MGGIGVIWRKSLLGMVVAGVAALAFMPVADAAEMLMYRKKGCPWCLAWDREIGPTYAKTEVGRKAPIRMIDLADKEQPAIALARRVIYTPTFVLIDHDKEVGRLEGYPGQDFFWSLIEELVERLPPEPPKPAN